MIACTNTGSQHMHTKNVILFHCLCGFSLELKSDKMYLYLFKLVLINVGIYCISRSLLLIFFDCKMASVEKLQSNSKRMAELPSIKCKIKVKYPKEIFIKQFKEKHYFTSMSRIIMIKHFHCKMLISYS